jgi:hypothetical protein
MPDDQRVYSDEEFALILRDAAELASRGETSGTSSAGLTLTEMQAIAAQVGLDPALVERAAHRRIATVTTSPFERVMGGPLRHEYSTRFPVMLTEEAATRLLSGVRISAGVAGTQDVGHAGPMGMTWHDGGELEALRITARPDGDSTVLTLSLDRRGTLGVVAITTGIAGLFAVLFAGSALYPESHALGYAGFVLGVGGVLAGARRFWSSSTKKAQHRFGAVMDSIGQLLAQQKT